MGFYLLNLGNRLVSKRALIFPGQGSQYVGMAKDIYESSVKAKELIQQAEEEINYKISEVMFNGPEVELKLTNITQPSIFLHSILLLNEINNLEFAAVAGHSLGEYSALVANNSLDKIDAFKLVRKRGEAMLEAGNKMPGTMAAIIGLEALKVEEICIEASSEGIVQCANFNSPGQIVISGSVEGVKKAMELTKIAGAKIAKELVVSGAFHSPLMASASDELKVSLDSTKFNTPTRPVYSNVTAKPNIDNNQIKELLLQQLTPPVRWEETILNMIEDGINEFIEVGPSKVLQGLAKRINKDVKISGIEKFED
ncbi:MAG: ACP S-malonyltransferase, partial [Ignavibacteriae bacterium]|nr:ACP S-malonyltransferase [Ignavibacteriota bacterium]